MSEFLPVSRPSITAREVELVSQAVASGWVSSLGAYIDEFERRFAAYCQTKFALSTSNGTVALHLALVSCGIGPGDEVVVPDITFVATANAVIYTGATVVLVDIERQTLGLDVNAVEKAITPRTKAIIPVHLYGHPANMDALNALAKRHNLLVVEDAAEAHGAEANGKKVGNLGACGVFSFYGNKILTCGEGGIITTNDETLYAKAKVLRDHAMSPTKRYWHTEVGFNYRMTNLQAALGVAQMERFDQFLAKRREIFQWYQDGLAGLNGVHLNRTAAWAKNVYWMICAEFDDCDDARRAQIMAQLKERGIDSRPYFYPLSDMPMYPDAQTPVAHEVSRCGINLPTYFDLTKADVDRICTALREILRG